MLLAYSFLFLVVSIFSLIFMKEKGKLPSKKEFESNHISNYTIFFAVRQVESVIFSSKITTLLKNCHIDGKNCSQKRKIGILTKKKQSHSLLRSLWYSGRKRSDGAPRRRIIKPIAGKACVFSFFVRSAVKRKIK